MSHEAMSVWVIEWYLGDKRKAHPRNLELVGNKVSLFVVIDIVL